MNKDETAELIVLASELVHTTLGQPLTNEYKILLEQALRGTPLKNISVWEYSAGTVERVLAPKLWSLLSIATRQKVGIKNVRSILRELKDPRHEALFDSARSPALEVDGSLPDTSLKVQPVLSPAAIDIVENLPAPTNTAFIGREAEVSRMLELLLHRSAHLISVTGIGGVGKTSLVVECARRCLFASRAASKPHGIPTFEVFVFVCAKLAYLEPFGLLERFNPARSLQDILQHISDALGGLDLAGVSVEGQVRLLNQALAQRRTLLIIDNLETVENQQAVLSFLYDLPASVKVVITTRDQVLFTPVRLSALSKADGLDLIAHEAQEKGVILSTTEKQALYQATGGIPIAIHYAIGQLASGCSIERISSTLAHSTGDIARFCFENAVQTLRGQPTHRILMALALFPAPTRGDALMQLVAAPSSSVQDGLVHLCRLSLVNQEHDRYSILPLTQQFALAELQADPDFARDARIRWVSWGLKFVMAYAQQPEGAWTSAHKGLQEEWRNLRSIADWCMAQGWYAEMLQFWQTVEPLTDAMGRRQGRQNYLDDRLTWTQWLIHQATQRSEWQTGAHLMLDRAWTLTAIRRREAMAEADELFEDAWELHPHLDLDLQIELAEKIAVLRTQQQQFEQAHRWLDRAESLLHQAQLDQDTSDRYWIRTRYYRGMSHYRAAEVERFEVSQVDIAQCCFEEARARALAIGWERAVRMSENWLAEIAVLRGELDTAEAILVEGLQVAKAQEDPTRMAFVKRSFAELLQARGDRAESKRWAVESLELFEQLEMRFEAEEAQAFIDGLANEAPDSA